ncbi:MAG TPA: ATP-binding protein, partial [Gemmatimonadales bacterium]|nr:ATP-binding protein [Gemmatimonadales bacterium]
GFAHFISREPGLTPAARADLIEIQKTTERMASLTRQLLAFARQQVLSPETLDLDEALEDTRPMLQRLIGSNNPIEFSLAPGKKWVRVDRAQLVQVLLNLVINARDAMPEGGRVKLCTKTVEVSPGALFDISQALVDAGAYAELTVEDSGQGISPEHLVHVFEPFYTTKDVGHGTGLGLATVEGIVSQSGGRILLESAVGRGTTITILLPLTSKPVPKIPAGSPPSSRAESRGRILVVDDEDAVRVVVSRVLQAEGYEVLRAREGSEALRELEEIGGAIDLVVTDVVMPGMGGAQLSRELGQRYPAIPVIWMSGHPGEVEFPDELNGKYKAFLLKPVPYDTLLETVARILENVRA